MKKEMKDRALGSADSTHNSNIVLCRQLTVYGVKNFFRHRSFELFRQHYRYEYIDGYIWIYRCERCGKRFSQAVHLRYHMQVEKTETGVYKRAPCSKKLEAVECSRSSAPRMAVFNTLGTILGA
ncbi:hypothetical protein B4U79_18641 [Dinothrombium tinctorium]|uniref:C2H2-type domain-containing protein n=1 Tax=Dinothrombium tinctorium TaxID=1965070 RepID=A0A3S3RJP1_9ACAR|nr:hypothetical protein B4U79_18642 [Dinothrombium tinctorium]RWS00679.1 hypothetical protein B4U79_18641 [Dinothrombium tinctorium]